MVPLVDDQLLNAYEYWAVAAFAVAVDLLPFDKVNTLLLAEYVVPYGTDTEVSDTVPYPVLLLAIVTV